MRHITKRHAVYVLLYLSPFVSVHKLVENSFEFRYFSSGAAVFGKLRGSVLAKNVGRLMTHSGATTKYIYVNESIQFLSASLIYI